MTIRIVSMYTKVSDDSTAIDTTQKVGPWAGLSPFNLTVTVADESQEPIIFENLWQFAKLYSTHATAQGEPTDEHYKWRIDGMKSKKPHRYPMGRGAKPLCSLWKGKQLGYIAARKIIYAPYYAAAVRATESYWQLLARVKAGENVTLRDYDGYDHEAKGMTLTGVLNCYTRKMGHAFVLKALLMTDAGQANQDTAAFLAECGIN